MIQEEKRRPIYVIQNVRDYGEYNHEIYGMNCLYSITFFGLEREGGDYIYYFGHRRLQPCTKPKPAWEQDLGLKSCLPDLRKSIETIARLKKTKTKKTKINRQ